MRTYPSLSRWLSGLIVLVLVISTVLSTPSPARAAAVIVVNTWKDEVVRNELSNKCSLREAVLSANKNIAVGGCAAGSPGLDLISVPENIYDGVLRSFEVLGTPGEDGAMTGDLDILEPVIIRGAGSDLTTISGNQLDRVFHIIRLGSNKVSIEDMKITRGSIISGGGGGILNYASTLALNNVEITGNHANEFGGGVRNKIQLSPLIKSTLIVKNSIISVNTTGGTGGGIDSDGDLEVYNSLVSSNTAQTSGGGIYNNAQPAYSSFIQNSTITENIAAVNGSGLYSAGLLEVVNSTIYANRGTGDEDEKVNGVVVHTGTQVTFINTILAGHTDPRENCEIQADTVILTNGHNLEDANTCGLDPMAGDLIDTPARLDSFGSYGSLTQLYGLLSDSDAIDGGANEDCPLTDQRGVNFGRPADGDGDLTAVCDIGAFEAGAIPALTFYLPMIRR